MRKRLPTKCGSIVLTIALVGIAVGCNLRTPPVAAPPAFWYPTGEYSTTDRDLTLVVTSYNFVGSGGQWQCTLFYTVLAPKELSRWQVTPGPVAISDDQGPLGTARAVPIESSGGVTLGALVIPPFRYNADALKIAITTMEAKNLTTGEVRELKGDWQLVPLRNMTPEYSGERPMLGGPVWPVKRQEGLGTYELTHQGTTLRYVTWDGRYSGFPRWVLGQQFWLSEPEPHDILVLVTWEGVSRVSADEYRRWDFPIFPLEIAPLVTPAANSE